MTPTSVLIMQEQLDGSRDMWAAFKRGDHGEVRRIMDARRRGDYFPRP